ncbi:hypothetical protein SOASR031_24170 [Leminorella grimontii]|nr:hypothetical protein SOASR031_24170 [Leminorella grimontii]
MKKFFSIPASIQCCVEVANYEMQKGKAMAGCGNCEMDRIGNSNAMKYIRIKNRRLDGRKENRRM